jgi:hypothetical protein
VLAQNSSAQNTFARVERAEAEAEAKMACSAPLTELLDAVDRAAVEGKENRSPSKYYEWS